MKKQFVFLLVLVMSAIMLSSCTNPVGEDITTIPPATGNVLISATDEYGNPLPGDTLYTGLNALFTLKKTSNFVIRNYEIIWGDGTANYGPSDTLLVGIHKYLIANTYVTVTGNIWDINGNLYSGTRTFWVSLGSNPTIPPIMKLGTPSVQINSNTWDYDLWFLKEAIDSLCSPSGIPYFLDSADGWVPRTMQIASDPRYYKITRTKVNNDVGGIQYRRDASCWASIPPRPGKWTSIYYSQNGDKLYPKFYGGQLYLRNQIVSSNYPGVVGDTTVRFSPSSNGDSIYVFFNKNCANGTNNPYWLSNIYGMGVQKTIYNVPGFPSWWYVVFHRNQLPVNTILTFRFGTSNGLANMSSSEFWDSVNQWLAVEIVSIGDRNTPMKARPFRSH